MLFGKSKAKNSPCTYCTVVTVVLAVIAAIVTIVSLIGLYMAHVSLEDGLVFGSVGGSMSIIALTINLFLVKKLAASCPCQCAMPAAPAKKK